MHRRRPVHLRCDRVGHRRLLAGGFLRSVGRQPAGAGPLGQDDRHSHTAGDRGARHRDQRSRRACEHRTGRPGHDGHGAGHLRRGEHGRARACGGAMPTGRRDHRRCPMGGHRQRAAVLAAGARGAHHAAVDHRGVSGHRLRPQGRLAAARAFPRRPVGAQPGQRSAR